MTQPATTANQCRSRDAKELLFVLPSWLLSGALFIGAGVFYGAQHWPKLFVSFWWVLFFTSPLLVIYTLAVLLFFAYRRNPVGGLLAVLSLPVLGFYGYLACMILTRGIALNTT